LLRDASLLCNVADSLLPERRAELPRFDPLVFTRSEPGLDDFPMPSGLQLFKETAKASGMAAIWSTGTNPLTLR